jgi:hypothetical protein
MVDQTIERDAEDQTKEPLKRPKDHKITKFKQAKRIKI